MTVKSKQSKRGGRRPGSGRKKGQPNKATIDLKQVARPYSKEAIGVLVEIMRDEEAPVAVRVNAADKLLDRSHGKAPVAIEVDASIDTKETSLDFLKENFINVMEQARNRDRALRIERGIEVEGEYKNLE